MLNVLFPQMKELEEAWSALPGDPAVPTRLLRSQQQSQAAAVLPTGAEGGGQEAGVVPTVVEAVDPYEFLDPVDMLEQMPKDFYEQLVCNVLCNRTAFAASVLHVANF